MSDNGEVVTDYLTKADISNKYFASQCTPFAESDEVPHVQLRTTNTFSSIILTQEKLLNIIRALGPNKTRGWDGVSLLGMVHQRRNYHTFIKVYILFNKSSQNMLHVSFISFVQPPGVHLQHSSSMNHSTHADPARIISQPKYGYTKEWSAKW